jgi:hypothetical protein
LFKSKRVEEILYVDAYEFVSGFSTIKSKIPQWYKDSEYIVKNPKDPFNHAKGVKTCVPFLDSLISGYCYELPTDIYIGKDQNGKPYVQWPEGGPIIVQERHEDINKKIPTPAGHSDSHFIWITPAIFKLPDGYSALITHPFNRFDLPFTTMSGIADADGVMHRGNVPFFIKDGFEGYVSKGTPIAQILPFKRDSWEMKEDKRLTELSKKNNANSKTVLYGWYKKNIWKKKSFE